MKPVKSEVPLRIIVDGKPSGWVNRGEYVEVKKSRYSVEFITKNDKNFFNKLLVKLNIWSK